jgi:hypothetical protein
MTGDRTEDQTCATVVLTGELISGGRRRHANRQVNQNPTTYVLTGESIHQQRGSSRDSQCRVRALCPRFLLRKKLGIGTLLRALPRDPQSNRHVALRLNGSVHRRPGPRCEIHLTKQPHHDVHGHPKPNHPAPNRQPIHYCQYPNWVSIWFDKLQKHFVTNLLFGEYHYPPNGG